ncbi:glucan endo-1,3-beta-glucosidase [Cinnamomum micranthum f. kanehirae]|uniref:Glucan endo-1,3-beta-glucosidase n=1 Tax=Cinnamomum micranthum f. kanehirae TaxID=337451 RepID=A0A443PJ07_9MAGN|nr:glucan endo-1,3-beta-glucosidase [Cinnamomum micranthum f. kanehirae]
MATLTSVITGSLKAQGLRAGCPPLSFNLRQEDHSVSFISHPFNASVRGRRALERATGHSVTTSGRRSLIVCRVVGAPLRFSSPSPVGLWYGKKSSSSLSPTTDQLIKLYKDNNIQKMWLCCDTPHDAQDIVENISSDGEANIQVVLYIPTPEVRKIAETPVPPAANEWIQLIANYQSVINYVCLGDVDQMNTNDITMIGTAMDRIPSTSKVSTMLDVNIILGSYDPKKCPSTYRFLDKFNKLLREVFNRLAGTSAPLFVKIFPYFAIPDNIDEESIGLDNYLLEKLARPYMPCDQLKYKYVFDAMVDSISCAIDAMHFSNVDISVVSGWPTAGSKKEATIENAQKYNKNLLRYVKEAEATPRKTKCIDHFIFSMVDEEQLPPDSFDWSHFGTFTLSWNNKTFPRTQMDC